MPRGKQPVVVCLFTPVPARPSSCTLRWRHPRSASTSGTGSSVVRPKEKRRGPDLQRLGAALFSVEEWNSATLRSQALCTGRRRHASDPCDDTPRHERWQSSCDCVSSRAHQLTRELAMLAKGAGHDRPAVATLPSTWSKTFGRAPSTTFRIVSTREVPHRKNRTIY